SDGKSEGAFHGFVGRKSIVNHLKTQLHGARTLGQVCPHIMIVGPSGMGKTKLAKALAQESGTGLSIVHGKIGLNPLCNVLELMQKGDFLFMDESHTLSRESQE